MKDWISQAKILFEQIKQKETHAKSRTLETSLSPPPRDNPNEHQNFTPRRPTGLVNFEDQPPSSSIAVHRYRPGRMEANNNNYFNHYRSPDHGLCSTKTLITFEGSKENDLEEWIFEIERYFQKSRIADFHKVDFSIDYLKGPAKLFFRSIPNGISMTWSEFTALLRRNYEPRNRQGHLRNRMETLKQKGQIEDYIRDFDKIMAQVRDMSKYDVMRNFVKGLNPKTRERVEAADPADVYEAKERALRVDTFEPQPYNQSASRNTTSNWVDNRQNNTYPRNHPISSHTYRDNTNRQHTKSQRCHKCNEDGWTPRHRCPPKLNQANIMHQILDKLDKLPLQTNPKFTMIAESVSSKNLITLPGRLNGENVLCIVDTGASASIVSARTIKKFDIELTGLNTLISMADGSTARVATTGPMTFELIGKTCDDIEFMVTNITAADIIVGLDLLHKWNVWIHPRKNTLVFAPEYVSPEVNTPLSESEKLVLKNEMAAMAQASVGNVKFATENRWEEMPSIEELLEQQIEWPSEDLCFTIDPELSIKTQSLLSNLLGKNLSCFAKNIGELGVCTIGEIHIDTGTHNPIYSAPYKVSDEVRTKLKKELDIYLRHGFIRVATQTNWASPAVAVIKKNGEIRQCVDFTKINKITTTCHFPIPVISDILRRLGASRFFTTLDGKQGFHQIRMHQDSIQKTCTIFPWGAYEWLVLPYGLKNAPAEFSRIMFLILGDLPFVEIYIDDIIIHSKTEELHLAHLSEVFRRLHNANLKLNPSKCVFFKKEIDILGHTVSDKGIQMDKTKVESVKRFPAPKSARDIQIFLGLTGYYRIFIRAYADIARPLIELTHKAKDSKQLTKKRKQSYYVPFTWTEECEKAFQLLKTKLCEDPILVHFDPNLPRVVHTDSSGLACGVILACINKENKEQVISYGSRLLTKQERNYTISEKEYLAIIYAIKKFNAYLIGTKFEVYTDHLALQSVFKLKDPNGRLFRMKMLHMPYDCTVKFRKGKAHTNVDALSRLIHLEHEPLETKGFDLNKEAEATMVAIPIKIATKNQNNFDLDGNQINNGDIWQDAHLLEYVRKGKHLNSTTSKQAERVERLAQYYQFLNPVIFYRNDLGKKTYPYVVPPPTGRKSLIEAAHSLGHFQAQSTIDRLQERYFWSTMDREVEEHVEKCHPCIRHEPKPEIHHPAQVISVTHVNQRCGIDCIGPLKKSKTGNRNICVITEYLTKLAFARPMKGKSAEDVAEVLWLYISIYGPPKTMLSDQGTEFLNSVINHLTTMCGVDHRITSPYRPQTNGLTERFNQTLVRALKKHCEDDPETWDQWIPFVLIAYNTRKNSTTGFSPYNLMYGRLMNHFEDYVEDGEQLSLTKRVEEIKEQHEHLHEKAKENIKKKQIQQIKSQNKSHKISTERFHEGQLVTIKALQIQGKLQPKYNGIYRITGHTKHGNYRLETLNGVQLKNSFISSRLKLVPEDIEEDDDEAHVEVDHIVKHRKYNRKLEFLVKWKDRPESENSWVSEADFDTVQCIEEYWSRINKAPAANLAFKKLKSFINVINLAMIMSTIIPNTEAIKINDNFKFCEIHDNKAVWDIPESCRSGNTLENPHHSKSTYYVLNKRSNEVAGKGWYCTATKRIVTSYQSFFGQNEISRNDRTSLELTREDCRDMVNSKTCNNKIMKCYGDYCVSEKTHEIKYSWLQTEVAEWIDCEIYAQQIEAEHANTKILTPRMTISSCLARDLYCKLTTGMIIWETLLIKHCPYEWVKTIQLERFSGMLISRAENKLFQVTGNTTVCDQIEVLTTAEGFFLSQDKQVTKLKKNGKDLKVIDELLLTEIDYNQMSLLQLVTNLFALTNTKMCQLYKSFVNLYTKIDDEFFTFSDFTGNEAILYSNEGQIFLPNCVVHTAINLIPETKECYRDIPIKLEINNATINAFLTKEKIIRTTSKLVPCSNNLKNVHLPQSKRIISMKENRTTIGDDSQYKHIPLTLQHSNVTSFNFHHDKQIISSINLVKKSSKLIEISEQSHGDFFVKEDHMTNLRKQVAGIIEDNIPHPLKWLDDIIMRICAYVGATIALSIASFIAYASIIRSIRQDRLDRILEKSP